MASLVLSPISPFPASYVTDHPTRVLVTGAGTPAAVAFMQSAADIDVELWASDSNRYAAGLFLVPSARRVLLPPAKSPEFAERLLIVSQALAIDVIVPMLDDELLPIASIRSRLAAARIGVLTSPGHVVASCLDQWLLVQTCLRHGVPVPRTKLLDRPMALRGFARPFTIRRRVHAGWGDSTVVGEHSVAPTVRLDGSHILQEYLTGEEYSIDVLAYSNGHVAAVVPRTRRRTHSGIAVAGSTLVDPELEDLGRCTARALQLRSVASIQARRDQAGTARVIEVCPRFPSGMPLTIASGVDMPALALSDALGNTAPRRVEHRQVSMINYWDEQFIETSELDELQTDTTAR
jgi:carbamoyl-phosphate synthase large subunit